MPLTITLGFREAGRTAAPVVLYCGHDASEGDRLSLTPPVGIIRTEFIKGPVIQRRRSFPGNVEAGSTEPVVAEAGPEIEPPAVIVEEHAAPEATTDAVVDAAEPEAADLPLPDAMNKATRKKP